MAFSRTNKEIIQLKNIEKNGFADLDGITIRQCADFIMTPVEAENTQQNAKNISNTFGNLVAWLQNVDSRDPDIAYVHAEELLVLYLYLAAAPYRDQKVEYSIHTFDPANPIDQKCMEDLRKLKVDESDTGMEKEPESILQLLIEDQAVGIYYPKGKFFIPGTGFRVHQVYGMDLENFIRDNPHIAHRCRGLFTNLLEHGADKVVLNRVLDRLGGVLHDGEMEIYRAEAAEELSGAVESYIRATSPDADPAAVCGYMGVNSSEQLVDTPILIHTGTAPVHSMNRTFKHISNNLVVIPPVKNINSVRNVSYKFGALNRMGIPELGGLKSNGIPDWIEFSAILDGKLYHKIYAGEFKSCQPDNYLDLAYMVPDGILCKYNYLVQESSAGSLGLDDVETKWIVYPEDNTNTVVNLKSVQYAGEWEIHQRATRIERMELCDAHTGRILGTVIPEKAPKFTRANRHMYFSLDPAGAVSVRLKSVAGTGVSDGLEYQDLIRPMTPMAKAEFDQTIERRMVPAQRSGTHFDSLIQNFFPEGMGGWSSLMVDSRIWKPDEKALFEALKEYPGTMTEAMTNLGVISNMKELLTRSELRTQEKHLITVALKNYIGTMLLEAVLALGREGYSVQAGNLDFMISYPENGSGEGITKQMKDIIRGAIGFVNEYLEPANQLVVNTNVMLCSESEATAVWHQVNPPAGTFIGPLVAAGTPDYGHSTHDFSLRVNGHLYMFSVPYAAQKITNATLAKVYGGNSAALMRCFGGGSQELKRQAQEALEEAMKSSHGKLHERLGFILPLNRLFSNCTFKVTGVNADVFQMKVQELTEAKLNIAIPAYAQAIVRALKDGTLKLGQNILFAPVGKGSLALNNTSYGYEIRFTTRLLAEINYLISKDDSFEEGTEYTGRIDLMPNNDRDKKSVAQGMIDMKENGAAKTIIVPVESSVEHYLDLVYGDDEEAKKAFRNELKVLAVPATMLSYRAKLEELYQNAFSSLIDNYTYEQFEEAFNRFGYTGIEDGITEVGVFDEKVRELVKSQFENLCAQLKEQGEELIMSCPGVENEMFCGALIDLAIDRMNLFEDDH